MPELRTDDAPRKLRNVWLGPKGATLPFQWTYVQWLVTLGSIPVVVGALWLILSALHVAYPGFWAVPWGTAGAMYGTVKVIRHVTYDEPLKHVIRSVLDEWRGGVRFSGRHQRVAMDMPEVKTLDQSWLRRMGWNNPDQLDLGREAKSILGVLRQHGGKYALELAVWLKLDYVTTDNALDQLEAYGLVRHLVMPAEKPDAPRRWLYLLPEQERYAVDRITPKKSWRQRLVRR